MNQITKTGSDVKTLEAIPVTRRVPWLGKPKQMVVSCDKIKDYFAAPTVRKLNCLNPELQEAAKITVDMLTDFFTLLAEQQVNPTINRRKLQMLNVPSTYQEMLCGIGPIQDPRHSAYFEPVMEKISGVTYDQALEVSNLLYYFKDDIDLVDGAFAREPKGDIEVMSHLLMPVERSIRSYLEEVGEKKAYPSALFSFTADLPNVEDKDVSKWIFGAGSQDVLLQEIKTYAGRV